MNLQELKTIIDSTINCPEIYRNPEAIPVLITTAEESIGARASSRMAFAGMGFDWEHGQFRIEPRDELVKLVGKRGKAKPVTCESIEDRKFYFCPECEERVAKNDYFCRHCGQQLKVICKREQ